MLGDDHRLPVDTVQLEIGDTDLPTATIAAGSSSVTSWGRGYLLVLAANRQIAARLCLSERTGAEPRAGHLTIWITSRS